LNLPATGGQTVPSDRGSRRSGRIGFGNSAREIIRREGARNLPLRQAVDQALSAGRKSINSIDGGDRHVTSIAL
jgi:hypothetical protein